MKEQNNKSLLITGILTLLAAMIFIFFPQEIINFLGYVTGVILMIAGLFNVVLYFMNRDKSYNYGFTLGLILFSFGLYLTINTGFILEAITVVFGFYILINGIMGLQFTLDAYMARLNSWKAIGFMAAINLFMGAIILSNPFKTMENLIMYIGIFMAVTGILSLITVFLRRDAFAKQISSPKEEGTHGEV